MKNYLFISIIILSISAVAVAQGRPRGGGGRPPQNPPMGIPRFPQGQPPRPDGDRRGRDESRGERGQQPGWVKLVDTNNDQKVDRNEYDVAANSFFKNRDKNDNGILEIDEIRPQNAVRPDFSVIPGFLFLEWTNSNLTKSDFLEKANLNFIRIDSNGNGSFDREELKNIRPPEKLPMPNNAMAQFIGAEMRFGNKTVKDSPFSAETIREENKRLYDGTIVKNVSKGLIFRDSLGRIRQEQPLEFIGGFAVMGENNQPKRLVNITDVVAGTFYSLSIESKTAFKSVFLNDSPMPPPNDPKDAKRESLGSKDFDGIAAEGTRITIEIPTGQIGNEKPIFIVTERWFSKELQMLVYSKHTDPFIGEVMFKLVSIKKGDPPSELFVVPSDFKINTREKRQKQED